MISDKYFVLEAFPNNSQIYDFRGHQYSSIKSLTPNGLESQLRLIDVDNWILELDNNFKNILNCHSKKQLYDKLEKIAQNADAMADGGMGDKKEIFLYCAIRDNVYQTMKLLER